MAHFIKAARLSVVTWTLVASRMHLIKDMRILIGKMVWEARFEANYEFDLAYVASSSSSSSSPAAVLSSASSVLATSSTAQKRCRK